VDARADGDLIGVGGWRPARYEDGSIDKSRSKWFSLQLCRTTAPWAYDRGEVFKTIASLEALAALMATSSWPNRARPRLVAPRSQRRGRRPGGRECPGLLGGAPPHDGSRDRPMDYPEQVYPLRSGVRAALQGPPREGEGAPELPRQETHAGHISRARTLVRARTHRTNMNQLNE
jgi:hypothetical protein